MIISGFNRGMLSLKETIQSPLCIINKGDLFLVERSFLDPCPCFPSSYTVVANVTFGETLDGLVAHLNPKNVLLENVLHIFTDSQVCRLSIGYIKFKCY